MAAISFEVRIVECYHLKGGGPMLSRRDLLMSGALASRLRPAEADALQRGAPPANDAGVQDGLRAIGGALQELHRLTDSPEVKQIRDRQRFHFKQNQKFPEYIDIGIDVWDRLITWHLENKLELKAGRTPSGRMEMDFLFTRLVLRADVAETMISNPYD
jgi:hypothetical protein